jgi:hypothetical protein
MGRIEEQIISFLKSYPEHTSIYDDIAYFFNKESIQISNLQCILDVMVANGLVLEIPSICDEPSYCVL